VSDDHPAILAVDVLKTSIHGVHRERMFDLGSCNVMCGDMPKIGFVPGELNIWPQSM